MHIVKIRVSTKQLQYVPHWGHFYLCHRPTLECQNFCSKHPPTHGFCEPLFYQQNSNFGPISSCCQIFCVKIELGKQKSGPVCQKAEKNVKLWLWWTNFDRPSIPAFPKSLWKDLWYLVTDLMYTLNETKLMFCLRRVHFCPKPLSKLRDFGRIYLLIQ